MRNAFCSAMCSASDDPKLVFLTGDLGFNALESLRDRLGKRFINAGVAEQNMIGVACGLASEDLQVWTYSIAPFLYARAFEQIRNDICMHALNVRLVGNGGGFAYGVMGGTHHAVEDYGVLLTLPQLKAFVPVCSSDITALVPKIQGLKVPSYLRLARDEWPKDIIPELPYEPWRTLPGSLACVLLVVGSIAGTLVREWYTRKETERPSLWILSELPVGPTGLDPRFIAQVEKCRRLVIVEEHVAHGSIGEEVATRLLENASDNRGIYLKRHCIQGPSLSLYGSQSYHRKQSGLDVKTIFESVEGR